MIKTKNLGFIDPIFGVIIILILLAVGAFYALSSRVAKNPEVPNATTTTIYYSTTTVATSTSSTTPTSSTTTEQ